MELVLNWAIKYLVKAKYIREIAKECYVSRDVQEPADPPAEWETIIGDFRYVLNWSLNGLKAT
jgi:hypothetical protein